MDSRVLIALITASAVVIIVFLLRKQIRSLAISLGFIGGKTATFEVKSDPAPNSTSSLIPDGTNVEGNKTLGTLDITTTPDAKLNVGDNTTAVNQTIQQVQYKKVISVGRQTLNLNHLCYDLDIQYPWNQ